MLELRPGDAFAGCKVLMLCGRGGFGTVYLKEIGFYCLFIYSYFYYMLIRPSKKVCVS